MAVYTRPHKRKLPKRSRTLPVYGEGDDEGKYFRCWNCGFICNVDRDELGDSDSYSGNAHKDYHENHHYSADVNLDITTGINLSEASKYACLGGDIEHYQVAQNIVTPDEEAKFVRHEYTSDISRGCPFCGSTNWRGDY